MSPAAAVGKTLGDNVQSPTGMTEATALQVGDLCIDNW